MKVVVCDDDKRAAAAVRSILYRIAVRRGLDIKVVCVETAAACYERLRAESADLVILETDIAGTSGIALAKRLRDKFGFSLALIFLTDCNDHAAESYEVEADYYLLKPCDEQKLLAALERAQIFEKEKIITVHDGKNILQLKKDDIIAIEVIDKNCRIYTVAQDYEVHIALKKLKELLPSAYFWHVHRSYIVNIKHIEEQAEYDFYMAKGIRVPIRRSNFSEIKSQYTQWMLNKMS